MEFTFLSRLEAWHLMLILLALMIISIFFGLISGKKYNNKSSIDSTVLGSLLALLGLLLAFTFSLSLNHYDARREIIIEEANDIGTVILRTNLYRESDGELLKADLKKYVDTRIAYYSAGADEKKVMEAQKLTATIQKHLWNQVAQLSKDPGNWLASLQMIPALNGMIDITTTRFYANFAHLPDAIVYLLFLLSCSCTFYMGFILAGRERFTWLLAVGFCLLTSMIVLVIFDLDRPRRGFIKLDKINQSIVDLKQRFPEQ
jgi:hypothetical protein